MQCTEGDSEGLSEPLEGMADEVKSKKLLPHKPRGRHCANTATIDEYVKPEEVPHCL
jgi:hypothetical protein